MKKMLCPGSGSLFLAICATAFLGCKKNNDKKEDDKETKSGVTITWMSVTHAKTGATMEIKGTGFDMNASANTVSFNGKNAEVLKVGSEVMEVKVPVGGGNGKINITNANGTATSPVEFIYDPTADFTFTTESNLVPGHVKLSLVSTALAASDVKYLLGSKVILHTSANVYWWFQKTEEMEVTMIAYAGKATDTIVKKVQLTTDNSLMAFYQLNASGVEEISRQDGEKVDIISGTDRKGVMNGAVTFNGISSYLKLPKGILKKAGDKISLSIWYQAAAGVKAGGLFGYQNKEVNITPTNFTPSIYIGTNKKMYAKFWFGTWPIMAPEEVDQNWHHLVLAGDDNNQILYIDGVKKETVYDIVETSHDMDFNQLGVAYGGGTWPAIPSGYFYFSGQMDDMMIFKKKLTAAEAKALYDLQKQ